MQSPRYPWYPGTRDAYEIWYGKVCGAREGGATALWFRYTIECHAPGEPGRASAWAVWYDTRRASGPAVWIRDFEVPCLDPEARALAIRLDPDNSLIQDAATGSCRATGRLGTEGRRISWDLSWEARAPAFPYMRNDWLRRRISSSGAGTPYPHTSMDGRIELELDGTVEGFEVVGSPGMQGHIWGRKKAWEWAWAHGNDFRDASDGRPVDAALEVIHAVRTPGSPPLTAMLLVLDGQVHAFNRVQDLLPWPRLLGGNRAVRSATRIDVEREGDPEIRASFEFLPGQVAEVEYRDTDGSRLRNRNGSLARAELRIHTRAGRRHLISERTATLELVDRG